jgi:hypothetical protein
LEIGASNETDITESVIVNTLASVLGELRVTTSNILDFTYTSWTSSRRLSASSTGNSDHRESTSTIAWSSSSSPYMYVDEEEGGFHISRRLSGVASVSVNVVVDLSDTTYTSAASLESAITSTISTSQTDGSLSVSLSSNKHTRKYMFFFFILCVMRERKKLTTLVFTPSLPSKLLCVCVCDIYVEYIYIYAYISLYHKNMQPGNLGK